MTNIDSLHHLFGLASSCSDSELRRAYCQALHEHHPDKNPDRVEAATLKTRELNEAYAILREHRVACRAGPQGARGWQGVTGSVEGMEFGIHFGFRGVDLDAIAARKAGFRTEWERFQQEPTDPKCALELIHAAFQAERQDSVQSMLLNPILIDSASLLLSCIGGDEVWETLIRWADFLQHNQRAGDALQILDDALDMGKPSHSVREKLRALHYSLAQHKDPTTGRKPAPEVRIHHLSHILELGFRYEYVHKLLAEAYHDCGDDEQARAHLSEAYRINPALSGAVRISRALGFSQQGRPATAKRRARRKYKYSRPEQISSPSQIRERAQQEDWTYILGFANPEDNSPPVLPKSRNTLREIAKCLGKCDQPQAREALATLLQSTDYWDVRESAIASLSTIGDNRTLKSLQTHEPGNTREYSQLKACFSYLEERMHSQLTGGVRFSSPKKLMVQAETAFAAANYGKARLLLENVLARIEPRHRLRKDAVALLGRCCNEMRDTRTAVDLVKPVLAEFTGESRQRIAEDLTLWLWNELVFAAYDPADDKDYLLALNLHLDLALASETPEGTLGNLRRLTRWLEMLGAGASADWIRREISTQAPGTGYVDKHSREHYVRAVELSAYLGQELAAFDKHLKATTSCKLRQFFEGPQAIDRARMLLDDT